MGQAHSSAFNQEELDELFPHLDRNIILHTEEIPRFNGSSAELAKLILEETNAKARCLMLFVLGRDFIDSYNENYISNPNTVSIKSFRRLLRTLIVDLSPIQRSVQDRNGLKVEIAAKAYLPFIQCIYSKMHYYNKKQKFTEVAVYLEAMHEKVVIQKYFEAPERQPQLEALTASDSVEARGYAALAEELIRLIVDYSAHNTYNPAYLDNCEATTPPEYTHQLEIIKSARVATNQIIDISNYFIEKQVSAGASSKDTVWRALLSVAAWYSVPFLNDPKSEYTYRYVNYIMDTILHPSTPFLVASDLFLRLRFGRSTRRPHLMAFGETFTEHKDAPDPNCPLSEKQATRCQKAVLKKIAALPHNLPIRALPMVHWSALNDWNRLLKNNFRFIRAVDQMADQPDVTLPHQLNALPDLLLCEIHVILTGEQPGFPKDQWISPRSQTSLEREQVPSPEPVPSLLILASGAVFQHFPWRMIRQRCTKELLEQVAPVNRLEVYSRAVLSLLTRLDVMRDYKYVPLLRNLLPHCNRSKLKSFAEARIPHLLERGVRLTAGMQRNTKSLPQLPLRAFSAEPAQLFVSMIACQYGVDNDTWKVSTWKSTMRQVTEPTWFFHIIKLVLEWLQGRETEFNHLIKLILPDARGRLQNFVDFPAPRNASNVQTTVNAALGPELYDALQRHPKWPKFIKSLCTD